MVEPHIASPLSPNIVWFHQLYSVAPASTPREVTATLPLTMTVWEGGNLEFCQASRRNRLLFRNFQLARDLYSASWTHCCLYTKWLSGVGSTTISLTTPGVRWYSCYTHPSNPRPNSHEGNQASISNRGKKRAYTNCTASDLTTLQL